MSPGQPEVATGPPDQGFRQDLDARRPRDSVDANSPTISSTTSTTPASSFTAPEPSQARGVVRLFQCRLCSSPFRDPVALPCGRALCRTCLPQPHDRLNITYPTGLERSKGIVCPFDDCRKEHALIDCSSDIILNKLVDFLRDAVIRDTREVGRSTSIAAVPPRSSQDGEGERPAGPADLSVIQGGQLAAVWALADRGGLHFDQQVVYGDAELDEAPARPDSDVIRRLQDDSRSEMDCQVCYGLFCDPLTTACGHTFCRSCLQRILDHSQYCPICRRRLPMNPMLNRTACPSNSTLSRMIDAFWADELVQRRKTIAADQDLGHGGDYDIALFVCTMAFPMMPTFLHVFEPRYRLLIRRALDGDRTFGMVLPKRPRYVDDAYFHEYGTLLRITNAHFYPDGRSLVETRGVSRFRVIGHGILDGYAVGKIERIDDVSVEEEEESEAQEAQAASARGDYSAGKSPQGQQEQQQQQRRQQEHQEHQGRRQSTETSPPTPPPEGENRHQHEDDRGPQGVRRSRDADAMSTRSLADFALEFVSRMRARGVPWLSDHMIEIYGECPSDAALLPWWLASTLPLRDSEKYLLLRTSSVRDRLKICYRWIVEWESSPWWVLLIYFLIFVLFLLAVLSISQTVHA
ncbi:ATP-dependent protease La (LON) domain [Geosmithia morbida]|uniref:ATP-dependent protease La (LON) domain n=1 Tax=Geosmithia morbida TaxID=1094350 RepID=A0A9P5D465_9HYPO|nr:ATP-dependent protease La (LON) domain [Geosmithia morbida]KAF4123196.1 ATP-dependent protease La (LON) domain [Geosmithia morbida]